MTMILDHPPPSNPAAERAILGAMLHDPAIVGDVLASVRPGDYHSYAHGMLHGIIADLHERGITPDILSIGTALTPDQQTEIGGLAYLAVLVETRPVTRDWRHFADNMREAAPRRDLHRLANDIKERVGDMGESPGDIVRAVEARCREADGGRASGGWWTPLSTAQLLATARKPAWLVKRLLVDGQPAIVGAPRKCLKTSIAIDLAISLASGTPFLGSFDVYARKRVAIVSGESGDWTILETAKRIAAARGISIPDSIVWNFRLPSLSSPSDLASLKRAIKASGIEVLILDPLYLCLLSGGDADSSAASNLYAIGPLLSAIAQACLPECTPILLHHSRKNLTNPFAPLELEDLAFAGIQEFARQWVLLNRMAPYEPGSGRHDLWLSGGGSCGQSGLWALGIEEGQLGDDFTGRGWQVTVTSAQDAIAQRQDAKADRRDDAKDRRIKKHEVSLLAALDKADPDRQGIGYTQLRRLSALGNEPYGGAVERLILEGIVEDVPDFAVATANGGTRSARGIRRRNLSASDLPSVLIMRHEPRGGDIGPSGLIPVLDDPTDMGGDISRPPPLMGGGRPISTDILPRAKTKKKNRTDIPPHLKGKK